MDYIKTLYTSVRALLVAYVAGSSISAQAQSDSESQVWQRAQELGTIEANQDYLNQYPTGRFASDAFRNIVERSIEANRGSLGDGVAVGTTRGVVGTGIAADLY